MLKITSRRMERGFFKNDQQLPRTLRLAISSHGHHSTRDTSGRHVAFCHVGSDAGWKTRFLCSAVSTAIIRLGTSGPFRAASAKLPHASCRCRFFGISSARPQPHVCATSGVGSWRVTWFVRAFVFCPGMVDEFLRISGRAARDLRAGGGTAVGPRISRAPFNYCPSAGNDGLPGASVAGNLDGELTSVSACGCVCF